MPASSLPDPAKPLPATAHPAGSPRADDDACGELLVWRLSNLAMATALATMIWGFPALIMAALAATGLVGLFLLSLLWQEKER